MLCKNARFSFNSVTFRIQNNMQWGGQACLPTMGLVMWGTSTAVHWLGHPAIIHWGHVLTKGWRCLPSYLPLRISCCLMFFMKWIFLKLFGRGEPDRVRHLKCNKQQQQQQQQTTTKHTQTISASKNQTNCVSRIHYTELKQRNVVANNVNSISGQCPTCAEEHSPQCPPVFQVKSAER